MALIVNAKTRLLLIKGVWPTSLRRGNLDLSPISVHRHHRVDSSEALRSDSSSQAQSTAVNGIGWL